MQKDQLRRLAEQIIDQDTKAYNQDSFSEDVRIIMHELLVHQIELEMQNSELIKTRAQLEALKEKYKKLFQLAPVNYISLDKNGKIVEWNDFFVQTFAISSSSSYLKNKPFVVFVEKESQESFYDHLNQVFNSKSKEVISCKLRLKNSKKSFTALLTSQQVDYDTSIKGDHLCLTTIEDIDAQEQINHNLNLAKMSADKANHAKSMFLANMSHEIRTPLNGILGTNQLLLMENLNETVKDLLMIQQKASKNLLQIVDDVLDYSKIEAGKMEAHYSNVNIRKLVKDIVDLYTLDVMQKNIYLIYSICEEIPEFIWSDQLRLLQVLTNLVGNAIKFTSIGGVEILISLSTNNEEEIFITFEISDTGIGIPEHLHDQLFRGFSQIDNSYTKQYKGTGLGLAISEKLVKMLNGSITFSSAEGVGSRFFVNIPLNSTSNGI